MQQLSSTSEWVAASRFPSASFDPHALRVEISRAADSIVERVDLRHVPVSLHDLERMASLRKIRAISKVKMNSGGAIIPVRGGFIVQLDEGQTDRMYRTSLAHEIGHTFFYDLERETPRPIFWKRGGSRNVEAEEGLSWVAARSLLIPRKAFVKLLEEDKGWPSISCLLFLIQKFDVSSQVMMNRLQDIAATQSSLIGSAIVYRVSVSRTLGDGIGTPGKTIASKFGRMKKFTALNLRKNNPKIGQLVEAVDASSTIRPCESDVVLMRGELGQIPTGRYRIGISWESPARSVLLIVISSPRSSYSSFR